MFEKCVCVVVSVAAGALLFNNYFFIVSVAAGAFFMKALLVVCVAAGAFFLSPKNDFLSCALAQAFFCKIISFVDLIGPYHATFKPYRAITPPYPAVWARGSACRSKRQVTTCSGTLLSRDTDHPGGWFCITSSSIPLR